jgi:S1-C subfamily serine protease
VVPFAVTPVVVPDGVQLSAHELRARLIERAAGLGWPIVAAGDEMFAQGSARYVLGGAVEEVYDATWQKDAGIGLDVRWEVRDQSAGTVVYRVMTRGFASGEDRLQRAFEAAVDSLLAREGLAVTVLRPVVAGLVSMPVCPPQGADPVPAIVELAQGAATGRGVLVSPEGHIWTAAQVVMGADTVWVTMSSGLRLEGSVVARDTERDIALLRVPGAGFPCRSPQGAVGVGAPVRVGGAGTVLSGTVRAARSYDGLQLLQLDGAGAPARGAPVFDPNGGVVGVVGSQPAGAGLSFVIPAPTALEALNLRIGAPLPELGPPMLVDTADPPIEAPVGEICLFRTSPGAPTSYEIGRFTLTLGPGEAACVGVPKGAYDVGRAGGLTTRVAITPGDRVYVRVLKAGLGVATAREYEKLVGRGELVVVDGG